MIRVFPRRTSYTPTDDMAFVGDPPLIRPTADEVHVSACFTWDYREAERLALAWRQFYPLVKIGGPAFGSPADGFQGGLYVKEGVTFTSRGCNNRCPWCIVPMIEGRLRELHDFPDGYIIQDNNFLQTSRGHRYKVYDMLEKQPKAAKFAGGLQPSLVTVEIASELRPLRIDEVFLAADTKETLPALRIAIERLGFLSRRQLRCYVLVGYDGETISQARERLEAVWGAGALPFAQLYRPRTGIIRWESAWKALVREWSRPAAIITNHKNSL